MQYKQKLIDILKTVPEIKEDLEELILGCVVILRGDTEDEKDYGIIICDWEEDGEELGISDSGYKVLIDYKYIYSECYKDEIIEIIGNPLKENHIRRYITEQYKKQGTNIGVLTGIDERGKFCINISNGIRTYEENIQGYDTEKDLDNQNEEVYKNIVEFLEGNTPINE